MDEQAWRRRLCTRVREVRRQTGLSQMQFALKADLSYHTVGKIERLEVFPNLETLIRISEGHQVPIVEFFDEPAKITGKKEKALRELVVMLRRKDERRIGLATGLIRYLFSKL